MAAGDKSEEASDMSAVEFVSREKQLELMLEDERSFEWLGQREIDGLLYTVWKDVRNGKEYAAREIRTVHMGFNSNEDGKVEEFVAIVEREGACKASWGVTGRTMHQMLASQLAGELPQYEFEIDYDRYGCLARKPAP